MSTANTLTNLIPDLFTSLDVVSRELVGMIPSVTRDATADRVAVGADVYVDIAPASTAADITPAVTAPDTGEQTIGNVKIEITKSRAVPFRWQGEDTGLVANPGPGALNIRQQQIAQAMRTLTNEIENDLCDLYTTFSRAAGTSGTTPFATAGNFTDASLVNKILKDNGAPGIGNRLIIDTTAGANMIGLQSRADIAGDITMQRQGIIQNVGGMQILESAEIQNHTAGTGASATTDNTGYAIGATVLTLASAGTGTLLAGDVVTFAGDTNQYVIVSGDTDVSDGGTITLAEPGLRVAMSAATKAITVTATSVRNMAFSPSAIVLAQRSPLLPDGGDSADDRMSITDPRSGLSFELSVYRQYRQVHYELASAWGVKNIKPEHTALLMGV